MDEYLVQCKSLSLTARMSVALLAFERFCEENQLRGDLLSDFSAHLWQWPLVDGSDQFESWENSRPELVNYGLGDEASTNISLLLADARVEEERFRLVVSGIVEILWGSFWGASEDELSMEALKSVLAGCKLRAFPPITPFKFSKFDDLGGWGTRLTIDDREYWMGCNRNV